MSVAEVGRVRLWVGAAVVALVLGVGAAAVAALGQTLMGALAEPPATALGADPFANGDVPGPMR